MWKTKAGDFKTLDARRRLLVEKRRSREKVLRLSDWYLCKIISPQEAGYLKRFFSNPPSALPKNADELKKLGIACPLSLGLYR